MDYVYEAYRGLSESVKRTNSINQQAYFVDVQLKVRKKNGSMVRVCIMSKYRNSAANGTGACDHIPLPAFWG